MPATITHRFPRYIALPAVSAGIIGGAALGMAGMANASTYPSHDPTPRTGIVAKPETTAQPPATSHPGQAVALQSHVLIPAGEYVKPLATRPGVQAPHRGTRRRRMCARPGEEGSQLTRPRPRPARSTAISRGDWAAGKGR